MVDVKISGLPNAAALTGNEAIPAVQGGSNVKVLVSAIRAGLATSEQGLPSGGTAGQFVQRSATGTQWAGAIPAEPLGINNTVVQWIRLATLPWQPAAGSMLMFDAGSGNINTTKFARDLVTASVKGYSSAISALTQSIVDDMVSHLRLQDGAPSIPIQVGLTLAGSPGSFTGVDLWIRLPAYTRGFTLAKRGEVGVAYLAPPLGGAGNLVTAEPAGIVYATAKLLALDPNVVHNVGDENIAGAKTYTSNNAIRSLAAGAGFWLESLSAPYGFMVNTDGTRLNVHLRSPNFGAQVSTLFQFTDSEARTGTSLAPFTANTQTVGTAALPFNQFFAQNTAISASDARLKTPLETMTDAEEAAFLEINELAMKWKWLERVSEEGDDARWHAGPAVQAAAAVMEQHDLDPFAYSAFCYDSWSATEEVWHEIPAQEGEWLEIPAQDAVYEVVPATYAIIPAKYDEATGEELEPARQGEMLTPERQGGLLAPAVEARRICVLEGKPAERILVEPAREAGDRYSFRTSELHAWILAAMARRDRREREAVELRLANIEQRLAVLESGK